ncbi:hypothetical protein GUJ93_ZPchr0008g13815 [Zizania palustris]|uniref:Retrotransposon gag domain-containing protein n=1 Tax=Zizania palustris TaxID=103762 RepID=A0A8J5RL16_ZIZPA|nr:hypothetical protein GUJ93_ZPchr0008g13815 [Zizania palustris]
MEEEKVWLAAFHLTGAAQQWYTRIELDRAGALTEAQQIALFTQGLKGTLQIDVELQAPASLETVMSLARAFELRAKIDEEARTRAKNNQSRAQNFQPATQQFSANSAAATESLVKKREEAGATAGCDVRRGRGALRSVGRHGGVCPVRQRWLGVAAFVGGMLVVAGMRRHSWQRRAPAPRQWIVCRSCLGEAEASWWLHVRAWCLSGVFFVAGGRVAPAVCKYASSGGAWLYRKRSCGDSCSDGGGINPVRVRVRWHQWHVASKEDSGVHAEMHAAGFALCLLAMMAVAAATMMGAATSTPATVSVRRHRRWRTGTPHESRRGANVLYGRMGGHVVA